MSNRDVIKNVLLAVVALAALVLAIQPFGDMSSSLQIVGACIVVAGAALISVIALRDKPRDEREQEMLTISEKSGFIVGILVTGTFVLIGAIQDEHNTELKIALASMLLAKLATVFYLNKR